MIKHRVTSVAAFMTLLAVLLFSNPSHATESASDDALLPSATEQVVEKVAIPTSEFHKNMKVVFEVGSEVGNAETLQAILIQESRGLRSEPVGNKSSPIGRRSYGLMQVQLAAAKSVLQRYPEVFDKYFPDRTYKEIADEEFIALLLTNDEANVRIAAYHFKLYLQLSNGNWSRAVCAYNIGIGAVQRVTNYNNSYVQSVKKKLTTVVKTFNHNNGLLLTAK